MSVIVWMFGTVILWMVGRIHITLVYVASFVLFAALRAQLTGHPFLSEVAPITGPMYQLFIFFMITDPRTIVRDRRWQIAVAVIIAFVETVIRFGSDQGWPLPTAFSVAPAFLALALVGPVAKWIDLRCGVSGTPAPAPYPQALAAQATPGRADRESSPTLRAGR